MSHLSHLSKNKKLLEARFEIIRLIRQFFSNKGFTEVETPLIVRLPGQEPYLWPIRINVHNEKGEEFKGYLHTSPEYTMKKMLAAGFDNIFCLGKCFRDYESFGGTHNPEFTMIEWYRKNANFTQIMTDIEKLFKYIGQKLMATKYKKLIQKNWPKINQKWEKISMTDLWLKFVNVNLDDYLTLEKISALCREKGFKLDENSTFEDYFYKIFLNLIEPNLGLEKPVIIHHYPAQMAALSRLSQSDQRYAERFELYIGGLEIANCFSELIDADEQLQRLKEDLKLRQKLGKEIFDIDYEFINALKNNLPEMAGIALGVDRLVQVFLACENINNVITLPMSELFD